MWKVTSSYTTSDKNHLCLRITPFHAKSRCARTRHCLGHCLHVGTQFKLGLIMTAWCNKMELYFVSSQRGSFENKEEWGIFFNASIWLNLTTNTPTWTNPPDFYFQPRLQNILMKFSLTRINPQASIWSPNIPDTDSDSGSASITIFGGKGGGARKNFRGQNLKLSNLG